MNKDLDILKAILLEAEEDEKAAEDKEKEVKKDNAEEKADDRAKEKEDKPDSPFDKDPMGFILKKYHTLNILLEELMTPAFKEYITAIFIQSPKPTSFKIVLHNSQLEKGWISKKVTEKWKGRFCPEGCNGRDIVVQGCCYNSIFK